MRMYVLPLFTALLVCGLEGSASANEVQAVLERAIQAHGGAARLTRFRAEEKHTRGTIYRGATGIPFTQQLLFQRPGQFKEVMTLEADGRRVVITTIFNGEKGWINFGGKTQELQEQSLGEVKETVNLARMCRLTDLQDPSFDLAGLGETRMEGRIEVGIRVASRGCRDVQLYFDKVSGLLARTERRVVDARSGKELTEERLFRDYRDVNGLKSARTIRVSLDGRKFMEVEVEDVRFQDTLDISTFARP